ncbi:MAG: TIM barrel protein [Elusimicrobia bacterium]|nr:TIM barrel protein [Elusimicrobiota bacterium]
MELAHRSGYKAVSFWSWTDKNIEAIRQTSKKLRLQIACFSGNREYTLIHPKDRAGVLQEVLKSLKLARRLNCPALNLLSDRLLPDGRAAPLPSPLSSKKKMETLVDSLDFLAREASRFKISLLLEPLNTKVDHPGCFLNSFRKTLDAVRKVDHAQVRILYDIYHMSVMGENVLSQIRRHLRWIGRLDVADAPGRHEPGTGAIDYPSIAQLLRKLKYRGGVGMEFFPSQAPLLAARHVLQLFV